MKQQNLFQTPETKPILSHLRPVRLEQWRIDGLFRKGKYGVGEKLRFVMRLRSMAFELSARGALAIKNENNSLPREYIMIEKRITVCNKFNVITDANMREIMKGMIVCEDLLGARYIAKKLKYPWPQFVIDFNIGLEQMMGVDQNV